MRRLKKKILRKAQQPLRSPADKKGFYENGIRELVLGPFWVKSARRGYSCQTGRWSSQIGLYRHFRCLSQMNEKSWKSIKWKISLVRMCRMNQRAIGVGDVVRRPLKAQMEKRKVWRQHWWKTREHPRHSLGQIWPHPASGLGLKAHRNPWYVHRNPGVTAETPTQCSFLADFEFFISIVFSIYQRYVRLSKTPCNIHMMKNVQEFQKYLHPNNPIFNSIFHGLLKCVKYENLHVCLKSGDGAILAASPSPLLMITV